MINIGIIGAGTILGSQIKHYMANPDCNVKSIADLNTELAKQKAEKYGIKNYYSDFNEIFKDKEIDAVCILTPTFTHKNIVLEAIKNNKHVFCEKPPALNADEVKECVLAAKAAKKILLYGFVCHFKNENQFMKDYINSGKLGKIICAEGARISLATEPQGWFASKKLGGGALMDEAIHELDSMLYLMDYPKPQVVMAFSSTLGNDLPSKLKFNPGGWPSADKRKYEKDLEAVIKGFINFKNGTNLIIKASHVLNTADRSVSYEINGEKAGIKFDMLAAEDKKITVYEITDDYYRQTSNPIIPEKDIFKAETDHFVNCCLGKEEPFYKPENAITLMEIIDAIYKSAETNKPIIF